MKKYISILIVVTLVLFAMTACDSKNEETQETTTAATTNPTEETKDMNSSQNLDDYVANDFQTESIPNTESETKNNEADTTVPAEEKSEPEVPTSEPQDVNANAEKTEYEKFNEMSGEEQKAFMESFPSIEDFFVWLNEAEAAHNAEHPVVEIDNEVIDAEDIIEEIVK